MPIETRKCPVCRFMMNAIRHEYAELVFVSWCPNCGAIIGEKESVLYPETVRLVRKLIENEDAILRNDSNQDTNEAFAEAWDKLNQIVN